MRMRMGRSCSTWEPLAEGSDGSRSNVARLRREELYRRRAAKKAAIAAFRLRLEERW